MQIESIQLYDHFGRHIPSNLPLVDFTSLGQIAWYVKDWLERAQLFEALVWVDNQRYMLVTSETYDIHYHGFFNNKPLKQTNK